MVLPPPCWRPESGRGCVLFRVREVRRQRRFYYVNVLRANNRPSVTELRRKCGGRGGRIPPRPYDARFSDEIAVCGALRSFSAASHVSHATTRVCFTANTALMVSTLRPDLSLTTRGSSQETFAQKGLSFLADEGDAPQYYRRLERLGGFARFRKDVCPPIRCRMFSLFRVSSGLTPVDCTRALGSSPRVSLFPCV